MPLRHLAPAALVLAGCGSALPDGPRDFAAISAAFDALNTRITRTAGLQPDVTLPQGSATYAGLARIDVVGTENLVLLGDASLSANFAAASVSGQLSRFVDDRDGAVSGSIALTGGAISGISIAGLEVDGDLGVGGRTLRFRGTGDGKFAGATGAAAIVQMGGIPGGPDQPGWQGEAYLDRR